MSGNDLSPGATGSGTAPETGLETGRDTGLDAGPVPGVHGRFDDGFRVSERRSDIRTDVRTGVGSGGGPGGDRAAEPRAFVRVIRPGGGAAGQPGAAPANPPMPMAPPSHLPPWLDPDRPAGPYPSVEDGLGPEEREVRDLLHRAVQDLQPTPGALDQLRRAVPGRRRQRRRVCGSVVLTLALCTLGTLALHSVGMSVDTADGPQSGQNYGGATDDPSSRGDSRGGAAPTVGPKLPYSAPSLVGGTGGGIVSGSSGVTGVPGVPGAGGAQPAPSITRPVAGTTWRSPSPGHGSGSPGSSAPAAECNRAQLGAGTAAIHAPDAAGVSYGTFQVGNVSGTPCLISLPGAVAVTGVTGTDPSRITVTPHSVGDPAGGLPAPASLPSPVRLEPGQSYLVEFAWVPATGAAAANCSGSSTTGTGDSSTPVSTDSSTPTATAVPPTVTLGHTPAAGGAVAASVVVDNACAGTVYRTAPILVG